MDTSIFCLFDNKAVLSFLKGTSVRLLCYRGRGTFVFSEYKMAHLTVLIKKLKQPPQSTKRNKYFWWITNMPHPHGTHYRKKSYQTMKWLKAPQPKREKKRKNISIWRQNQTEFPLILIWDRKYLRALSFRNFTEAKFKILPDIKQ